MKLAIEKTTKLVSFADVDDKGIVITDDRLIVGSNELHVADINDVTHEIVETSEDLPSPFRPELYKFENDKFVFNDNFDQLSVVTMRQAQLALQAKGKLDDVETAVQAGSKEMQIEWATAHVVDPASPMVAALVTALPLTPREKVELFLSAAEL